MKNINNVFYLDNAVTEIISNFNKLKKNTNVRINRADDSIIASLQKNGERRNILFRPDSSSFTYEVNGHFFGTFFYDSDKIIVKWPKRLNRYDHKNVINELQQIFRHELS